MKWWQDDAMPPSNGNGVTVMDPAFCVTQADVQADITAGLAWRHKQFKPKKDPPRCDRDV